MFAIAYFDDGRFRLRTFPQPKEHQELQRSESEVMKNEVDINSELGIDDWTMAIQGFADPYIVCCFVNHNLVFVSLFYNYHLTHYHFIWNIEKKQNFPYKCFYNDEDRMIYTFYRQG